MLNDIEKRRERALRCGAGRHGNHACGRANARWSGERRVTANGYVAVRVALDHPHGWGPPSLKRFRYAYEHTVVMMAAFGRPLSANETVHHKNGDKTDNRIQNLELLTRTEHAREHDAERGRDRLGRFPKRVREWPDTGAARPASAPETESER